MIILKPELAESVNARQREIASFMLPADHEITYLDSTVSRDRHDILFFFYQGGIASFNYICIFLFAAVGNYETFSSLLPVVE